MVFILLCLIFSNTVIEVFLHFILIYICWEIIGLVAYMRQKHWCHCLKSPETTRAEQTWSHFTGAGPYWKSIFIIYNCSNTRLNKDVKQKKNKQKKYIYINKSNLTPAACVDPIFKLTHLCPINLKSTLTEGRCCVISAYVTPARMTV